MSEELGKGFYNEIKDRDISYLRPLTQESYKKLIEDMMNLQRKEDLRKDSLPSIGSIKAKDVENLDDNGVYMFECREGNFMFSGRMLKVGFKDE